MSFGALATCGPAGREERGERENERKEHACREKERKKESVKSTCKSPPFSLTFKRKAQGVSHFLATQDSPMRRRA